MMLRLMLLRHAQAEAGNGRTDHARALTPGGRGQALEMGHYMQAEDLLPDAIVASDSARTLQTWYEMRANFDSGLAPGLTGGLYLAHPRTILATIHDAPGGARALLVVGHNPGLAELADALTGYGDRYAAARMRQKYPPCGLTVLDFDLAGWRDIAIKTGRLDRFVIPADIGPGAGE